MKPPEFIAKIKDKLGKSLPSDLVFLYKNEKLFIYRTGGKEKETILQYDSLEKNEFDFYIDECVRIIQNFYIK